MEKFSVIIPTIWKSEYTMELLERLGEHPAVVEIILIDNAPKGDVIMDKVIHIKETENTYVNNAWNKGVELAKCNHITIANDDILFDVFRYYRNMFQFAGSHPFDYTKTALEELGFIGSHSDNYKIEVEENVVCETYNNQNNVGGWGCLFSFHKRNWKPIPNQLKIWYGDNWIHATHPNILQLRGLPIQTKMSTSSDLEELRDVRDNDTKEWHKLLNNQ